MQGFATVSKPPERNWIREGNRSAMQQYDPAESRVLKVSCGLNQDVVRTKPASASPPHPPRYRLNGNSTPLLFNALIPNYDNFLVEDSTAAISLDHIEAELWFRSRGDCLLEGAEVVRVGVMGG